MFFKSRFKLSLSVKPICYVVFNSDKTRTLLLFDKFHKYTPNKYSESFAIRTRFALIGLILKKPQLNLYTLTIQIPL